MKRIVVFGYSVMSLEAMSRLPKDDCSILFIAANEVEAASVSEKGFETQIIDFKNDDDLSLVGIGTNVDIIFCFYPTDSDNVFLTISARAMDKDLIIIAIVDDSESEGKLLAAGANKIIDPYEICGRKVHEMLTKPDISDILDHTVFGRHDLNIAQIEIPAESFLEGVMVSELDLDNEQYNLILIGVVDKELGDQLHFTNGETDHELNAGDVLVVMGPSRGCRLFRDEVEHQCN
ncbi:MAG: NAD-binding protein [Methylococcaceae bacterium]|jgi:voltage-gated potassium channel